MSRMVLVAFLACVASACDGHGSRTNSPTAPTPAPSAARTFQVHLTGIVTDEEGLPASGATITVYQFVSGQTSLLTATSDASDMYEVTFSTDSRGVDAVAVKGGYEQTGRYIRAANAGPASQSFRLYRIRRITAGESARVIVAPDDSFCGDDDHAGYPYPWVCRTVRVMVSSSGLMSAEVVSENPGVSPALEIGSSHQFLCCSARVSLQVSAGEEILASILMGATASASETFTLKTSLE